jgi:hypothetical protein
MDVKRIPKTYADAATSRADGWRASLLSAVLGVVSVGSPHFGLLLLNHMQTFFQRETTLWMTYVILVSSAFFVGFYREKRWRHAAAILIGATAAVIVYLLVTVDIGGPQFYGAISPLFLWLVAVGTSVLLMVPVVILGVALGGAFKALSVPC